MAPSTQRKHNGSSQRPARPRKRTAAGAAPASPESGSGSEYHEERDSRKVYDSDALDDDDVDFAAVGAGTKRKRGGAAASASASPKKKRASAKTDTKAQAGRKKPSKAKAREQEHEGSEQEQELEDGQEIVGAIVQAPTTGQGTCVRLPPSLPKPNHASFSFLTPYTVFAAVPHGQISQNTLNFLTKLHDPKCNDREWYAVFHWRHNTTSEALFWNARFKLHGMPPVFTALNTLTNTNLTEQVYRAAEAEWKAFVDAFTADVLTHADPQLPPLPAKDVVHHPVQQRQDAVQALFFGELLAQWAQGRVCGV
ncbi:hypothetical protein D9615_009437 [Tricholomella constricta]|uniref:Uncharacterized protein n=1 Tax=Tricholomella constricta TaxID=117010 RepID=A0A8H5LXA5_9AGAR|nr:hypothetical protein D9615_009437 [Tricholomella constricta]